MVKNLLFLSLFFVSKIACGQTTLTPFYCEFSNAYLGQYQDHKTTKLEKLPAKFKFALDCSWNGVVYVEQNGNVIKEIEFKITKVEATQKGAWTQYKATTDDNCLIFFRYYNGNLEEISYFYSPNDLSTFFYLKQVLKYFVKL